MRLPGEPEALASALPTVVPFRHPGRWVSGACVLVFLGFLLTAFARAQIDYAVIPKYIFSPVILLGVINTMKLTALCMALGISLGIVFAAMRQSINPVLRWSAGFYVWFFRGTPVLVQLLIWFNLALVFRTVGVPGIVSLSTNAVLTPFVAALLGLGINEGAYMTEIVRSGMLAVDVGQIDAAQAVGLTRRQTLRRVILPQALRVIIPPTGNETIGMLKYTALAFVISYNELLSSAYKIYSVNLKVIELLFTACLWYLTLTTVLMFGQRFLERRYGRGFGQMSQANLGRTSALRPRVLLTRLWRIDV